MAMHTIQIPGAGQRKKRNKYNQHPDDHVSHGCDVVLDFGVAGCFQRSSGGDKFHPVLPKGSVSAGPMLKSTSPDLDEKVTWGFEAASDGTVTIGTICVEKGAKCEDPKSRSTRTAKTRR
jgi:hypothetical protein